MNTMDDKLGGSCGRATERERAHADLPPALPGMLYCGGGSVEQVAAPSTVGGTTRLSSKSPASGSFLVPRPFFASSQRRCFVVTFVRAPLAEKAEKRPKTR
jgi:hypothetical protein